MRWSSLIRVGAVALAAAAGCKGRPSGTAMRLSPVQVWSDGGIDATRLVDRDATTRVQIRSTTRVFLRLARPVAASRLKVQGARSLRVTAEGVGALGPPDEAGWATAEIGPTLVPLIALQLEPEGAGAELAEIEIWGAGETRASPDPAALAASTRSDRKSVV